MKKTYTKPRAVRLSEIENQVQEFLKNNDIKFSDLVKKSLVFYMESDRPKQEISLDEIVEELKKMRGNFSRAGGNLNQLSFYFNLHGVLSESELSKSHELLRSEFKSLTKFFRKIENLLLDYKG